MNKLQTALAINAAFSFASGVVLIIFNTTIANHFGISTTQPFWITGMALLFFVATLVYEIIKQNPIRVLWIIVQDFLWVLGSAVLILFNPFNVSPTGLWIIAAVALVVFLMAINQIAALSRVDLHEKNDTKILRFHRKVKADHKTVWDIISKVDGYHQFAPNIDRSEILSGAEEGLVRQCAHGKDQWTETCILWQSGHAYAFVVDTEAPDYPYPFTHLKGHWQVDAIDGLHSEIKMHFLFRYRYPFQNWLLHPFLRYQFGKVGEKLLDNWEEAIRKTKP